MNNDEQALKAQLEAIAASWDGCECDSVGETLEVGAQLRKQFAALQPTEQPEAAQDERERFEADCEKAGIDIQRVISRPDDYLYESTADRWEGWQAAKRDAAQAPQEPEIECTCPAIDMPFGRCCKAPPERKTDQWDSARVADYNQGWNDCCALLSLSAQSSEQKG